MTWLRCEDTEDTNPKIVALDAETFRLYHRSRLYAARHLTDGWIPAAAIPGLTPLRGPELEAALAALLRVTPPSRASLWERDGDAYRIHDYLEYNPSREEGMSHRAAANARMARLRERKRAAKAERLAGTNGHGDASHPRHGDGGVTSSRPVPSRPQGETTSPSRKDSTTAKKEKPIGGPPSAGDASPGRHVRRHQPPLAPNSQEPGVGTPDAGARRRQEPSEPVTLTQGKAPIEKTPGRPGSATGQPDSDEAPPLNFRQVTDAWFRAYEKRLGRKPLFARGKDTQLLVKLTREFGADLVCRYITAYFEIGTAWARERQAWSVGAFYSQWNVLAGMDADGQL